MTQYPSDGSPALDVKTWLVFLVYYVRWEVAVCNATSAHNQITCKSGSDAFHMISFPNTVIAKGRIS